MRTGAAVRWARIVFACIGVLALAVAIMVSAGVNVETPFWNTVRIVAFVLSLSALAVIGLNRLRLEGKKRENDPPGEPVERYDEDA